MIFGEWMHFRFLLAVVAVEVNTLAMSSSLIFSAV